MSTPARLLMVCAAAAATLLGSLGLRVGQLREREALEREARIQLDAALRQVHSDVRLATATAARQARLDLLAAVGQFP